MALRHASSFRFGLLAAACFVAGCGQRATPPPPRRAEVGPVAGVAATVQFAPVAGVSATVQFGHDVCGVPVYVGVRATTGAGAPVSDAEVWRVFEPTLTPPEPTRAELWGTTDAAGRLLAPECYAGANDTTDWAQRPDATRLVGMIVHPQFGMVRSVVAPPVDEVLTAVKQLPPTLQPGRPWSNYTVRMNVVVPPRR